MSRVLVVSRNPAMAMGLSATDHEVCDLRPSALGDWISSTATADALVLDLESPSLATAAVARLREHGKLAPVLLVSSDRPGWDEPQMTGLEASAVLPLPITRPALLEALERLLGARWAGAAVAEGAGPFLPVEHLPAHPTVFHTAEALASLVDEPDPLAVLASESPELVPVPTSPHGDGPGGLVDGEPTGADTDTAEPGRATGQAVQDAEPAARGSSASRRIVLAGDSVSAAPLSAVPRTRRTTALPSRAAPSSVLDDLDRLRVTSPAPPSPAVGPPRTRTSRRGRRAASTDLAASAPASSAGHVLRGETPLAELVAALLAGADQLYGVPETAEVAVADAVERTGADAGALLVPDDGRWRVAAGVGLRPLEHRYELDARSWLVAEVAQGNKGVIVEDSDIARERLQGAPLASWRHLLAAPVPDVAALFILARRDDPAFTEKDLTKLAVIGTEASSLLAAALETRALARRLQEFRDEQDRPR